MTHPYPGLITITLDSLRFYARHGVGAQERVVGNDFEVTLSVDTDAVESDNIANTVSYADLAETVDREMAEPSALIEHVAIRIRDAIITGYPSVKGGTVKVAKLKPPIPGMELKSASVTLSW